MAEPLELVKKTTLSVPGVSSGVGGGSAAPAVPNTAVPITDSIQDTPGVLAQQERARNNLYADVSASTAIGHAVRGTIMRKLVDTYNRAGTTYTGESATGSEKANILYESGVHFDDSRFDAAMRTRTSAELNDLISEWRIDDYGIEASTNNLGTSLLFSALDVDLLGFGALGVGSKLLRGAAVTTKAIGAGNLAARFEQGASATAKAADVADMQFKGSKLAGAVKGAIYGTTFAGVDDALTPEGVDWVTYASNAALFAGAGVLGTVGPNQLTEIPGMVKKLDGAELKATDVAKSYSQLLDASGKYKTSVSGGRKFTAEDIARMGDEGFVDASIAEIGQRWKNVADSEFVLRNSGWYSAGGSLGEVVRHLSLDDELRLAARSAEVDFHGMVDDVTDTWKHYFPDSGLVVKLVSAVDEAKQTLGTFRWVGQNEAIMELGVQTAKDGTLQLTTPLHELGHGIAIRAIGQAIAKNDKEVLGYFQTAALKHVQSRKATGITDPGGHARLPKGMPDNPEGFTHAEVSKGTGMGSYEYWSSPDEFFAQQFLKTTFQVAKEAQYGVGSVKELAQKSALFKSLPATVQGMMANVLSVFKDLFSKLFKADTLAPDASMRKYFEAVAENPGRIDNWRNTEVTAAHVTSDGQPLTPRADSPVSKSVATETPTAGGTAPAEGPQIPYGPKAAVTSDAPWMMQQTEKVLGQGWWSVFDNLNSRGGFISGLAQLLVVDGAGSTANSASMFKRSALLDLRERRLKFDQAIADTVQASGVDRVIQSAKFRAESKKLQKEVYEDLMRKSREYGKVDGVLPVNENPAIERLSQLYAESGYAARALEYLKVSGRFGADLIDENPYYVPMRTSADSLRAVTLYGHTEKDVSDFLTLQVRQLWPDMDAAYQEQVGKNLLQGIKQRGMGRDSKVQYFEGTTVEELRNAMDQSGFDTKQVDAFLEQFHKRATERNKDKNLRHRLDWDWDLVHTNADGKELRMRDLVNTDVIHTLDQYEQAVTGQYGMGMVGFKSDADLNSSIQKALIDYTERGATEVDVKYTQDLLSDVVDQLMGRAVGEKVPPLLRAASSVSAAVSLKNPVFYAAVEVAQAVQHQGAMRFVQGVLGSRLLNDLAGTDAATAARFQDVLSARLVREGRWSPVLTRLEDGWDGLGTMDIVASGASHVSRFLNGSEIVRRKLAKSCLSVVVSDVFHAARGDAAMATKLGEFGFTPELLGKIRKELDSAPDGHELGWDAKTRMETEAAMVNAVDQIITQTRLGELPAFLQFSQVGKVFMPYIRFIAGSYNKILRKGYQDHGGVGIAVLAAYQLAGATMAEAMKNLSAGREPTDSGQQKFVQRVISNTNMSSWFGYALDSAMAGSSSGTAQLAFPRLVRDAIRDPSLSSAVNATPLGVVPGMKPLLEMVED